jgi:hypothetical protein
MSNKEFSVPRLGWEGDLPDDIPEKEGPVSSDKIAEEIKKIPKEANYGPIESGKPEKDPSQESK